MCELQIVCASLSECTTPANVDDTNILYITDQASALTHDSCWVKKKLNGRLDESAWSTGVGRVYGDASKGHSAPVWTDAVHVSACLTPFGDNMFCFLIILDSKHWTWFGVEI
jgi:hypothetical protein